MRRLARSYWEKSCPHCNLRLHSQPGVAASFTAYSRQHKVNRGVALLCCKGSICSQKILPLPRHSRQRLAATMRAGPTPTPGQPVPPPNHLSTVVAPPPKKSSWYQKLGQSFNAPGIARFGQLVTGDGSAALPHLSVPNISHVNWPALRRAGFEGCVFDKDNTLTEPYAIAVAPLLVASLKSCIQTFDGRVALLSNSAGLEEFDPDGEEAAKLEKMLGVPVLRHKYKKPQGGADELKAHFGCKAERLVMVGDRYLTDVVYGNQNGMLTIRPAPLTMQGEPPVVRMARAVEERFVGLRRARGTQPPRHPLVTSADTLASFVKAP